MVKDSGNVTTPVQFLFEEQMMTSWHTTPFLFTLYPWYPAQMGAYLKVGLNQHLLNGWKTDEKAVAWHHPESAGSRDGSEL